MEGFDYNNAVDVYNEKEEMRKAYGYEDDRDFTSVSEEEIKKQEQEKKRIEEEEEKMKRWDAENQRRESPEVKKKMSEQIAKELENEGFNPECIEKAPSEMTPEERHEYYTGNRSNTDSTEKVKEDVETVPSQDAAQSVQTEDSIRHKSSITEPEVIVTIDGKDMKFNPDDWKVTYDMDFNVVYTLKSDEDTVISAKDYTDFKAAYYEALSKSIGSVKQEKVDIDGFSMSKVDESSEPELKTLDDGNKDEKPKVSTASIKTTNVDDHGDDLGDFVGTDDDEQTEGGNPGNDELKESTFDTSDFEPPEDDNTDPFSNTHGKMTTPPPQNKPKKQPIMPTLEDPNKELARYKIPIIRNFTDIILDALQDRIRRPNQQ